LSEPKAQNAVLLAILLAGLILRVWGIGFGLPHPMARPDEEFIVSVALRFFSGDLNPHFFEWPSLYFYVVHAALRVAHAASRLTGGSPDAAAFAAGITRDPGWVHLLLRAMSVAAAMGTLIAVHGLSRRLFGRRTAVVAVALLAVAYLHVRDSHFGVLDVPLTFLIVLTITLLVRASGDERPVKWFALAGMAAGFACSIKYNAAALLVPAAATALVRWRDARPGESRDAIAGLSVFCVVFAASFVAGTPYAVLDAPAFREGLAAQVTRLTEGHGIRIERVWQRHLTFSLLNGVGWPVLIAGVFGGVLLLVMDWRRWAMLLSFPAAYFLVIGNGHTAFIRYVTPLVPFVCIAAAFAVYGLIEMAGAAWSKRTRSLALAAAVVMLALPSTLTVVRFNRQLQQTDTRVLAADWLRTEMRAGESLFESGASYARPHFAWIGNVDFVETEFDAVRAVFTSKSGEVIEPVWVVLAESPLRLYTNVPGALRGVLTSRYSLVQQFSATREPEAEALFDRQDAFFLPYADFDARIRPGPTLSIYRLRD
jgi:4-amino-4-deoxy-L-arabinose transferase-like glycosyltransferase